MEASESEYPRELNCDQCGGLATVRGWQDVEYKRAMDTEELAYKICTIECPNCGTRTQVFAT